MGGILSKGDEPPMVSVPTTKFEAKILETMRRRESKGTSMKSFNTIILKFPKIDENLRKCKAIFEQFDEDKSGSIDRKELNHCFRKLEIDFTDEEINDIFEECDINDDMEISFNEFIVLLCLSSRKGFQDLEVTFETLVDSFVFLDKNKDGYVSRGEMKRWIGIKMEWSISRSSFSPSRNGSESKMPRAKKTTRKSEQENRNIVPTIGITSS
ncbi:Calcium-binding EF-hand [Cynara cardunculus var. scolymus]|uniref:Calcium-binding EF-hand n=1 Tax=Cynara cardunculus var. scolymus TaxID=59895 RepID=A0A103YJP3_CYNCS|nr:Calcium-binding EF-hand [Cynara cardunculus var. scolymus]